jgi:hypothetical protein
MRYTAHVTPGQRLSAGFWTVVLVIAVVAALDAVSHTLAVVVVLLAAVGWITARVLRAIGRPGRNA